VIAFDDGEIVETESATVTWLDDRFDWDQRDGENIQVFGYDASDDFMDMMIEVADDSMNDLIALYQPETVYPVRIWVYETGEDYAGTQAANSQEWSAGSAYPDLQVIHAVIPDGDESEVMRIIPHEISHQVLFMATMNPFNSPATWIDEGLAVLAQEGGTGYYDRLVEDAWGDDELLPMQGLISVFPFEPGAASMAYAQSYRMMSFIIDEFGDQVVNAIVQGYREGNSHDEVLIQALGMDLGELESLWHASLGDEFGLRLAA
jgi:hypothetical protein